MPNVQVKDHAISDSDVTDCESVNESDSDVTNCAAISESNSDSDKTVESDELDVIIKKNKIPHNNALKRKASSDDIFNSDSKSQMLSKKKVCLPICNYGEKCYRKNPDHLSSYYHPNRTKESKEDKFKLPERCERNPYQVFLSKASGISNEHNHFLSYHISEILSENNGDLLSSVQFNYLIDIPWLMNQYPQKFRSKPLLIVHGHKDRTKDELIKSASSFENISFCQANLKIIFGTHHTKMMILQYSDGLKIVIHTANLIEMDWNQKTQGIWVSPLYRRTNGTSGQKSSKTGFKEDLIEYLEYYNKAELKEWVHIIKEHDLSETNVHLIASVPGKHSERNKNKYGHFKLRKILQQYGSLREEVDISWPVIGQFSSIGSLGKDANQWLRGEWLASLSTVKDCVPIPSNISLKLIYPSVDDVRLSLEGYPGGTSLPYSGKTAIRQPYLNNYLHKWRSELRGRTYCCPHIKSYARFSKDYQEISWFLITSANLSKAAWGCLQVNASQLMIRSYELGVLFLPSAYEKKTFKVMQKDKNVGDFPVPFDVPLKPYSKQDKPWTWDETHREKPDRNGNMWCPC